MQISTPIPKNIINSENLNLSMLDIINKWIAIILAFMIPISTAGTNITALIILILFLASGQWNKKIILLKSNKFAIFALALYIALAIGILYSKSDSFHHDIMRLMKYNKLLLVPVIIYLFQDIKYKKIGLYSFMTAIALTLIFGYLHQLFNMPLPSAPYDNPGAIFIHHIITPCFMAFFTTFCLYKFINTKYFKYQAIWVISALLSIYYIYFISLGRTGYLIQTILLPIFIFYLIKSKKFSNKKLISFIFSIIALTIITLFIGIKSNNTLQRRINAAVHDVMLFKKHNPHSSNGARLSWYVNFTKLIAKKPIFGYGTGSLKKVYAKNFANKNLPLTGNPHNQYIEIAFKLGLFGLAIYLSMLFFAYKNLCDDPMINLMGKTAIILFMVGSCMNSWLLDLSPGFLLCYLAALANKPKTIK